MDNCNAFSTTGISGLADPESVFVSFLALVSQDLAVVVGEEVGQRCKVEYFPKQFPQLFNQSCQIIL